MFSHLVVFQRDRVPTLTCNMYAPLYRYNAVRIYTPWCNAERVRESAVAESISRACVCGRSMRDRKAKDNKKETDGGGDGAAVRQFGRVLCGRHVGHIAGERGFSMTTRSIGSMAPPHCGPYARVNTHRRRDVTDDGISVGTDPTTNRAS